MRFSISEFPDGLWKSFHNSVSYNFSLALHLLQCLFLWPFAAEDPLTKYKDLLSASRIQKKVRWTNQSGPQYEEGEGGDLLRDERKKRISSGCWVTFYRHSVHQGWNLPMLGRQSLFKSQWSREDCGMHVWVCDQSQLWQERSCAPRDRAGVLGVF